MQVIWNRKALRQFDAIIAYGYDTFGRRAAEELYRRIISYEPLLEANPYLGCAESLLAHRQKAYRSIVVHQHFKLVYYINERTQTVRIADLWDTRREPLRQAEPLK